MLEKKEGSSVVGGRTRSSEHLNLSVSHEHDHDAIEEVAEEDTGTPGDHRRDHLDRELPRSGHQINKGKDPYYSCHHSDETINEEYLLTASDNENNDIPIIPGMCVGSGATPDAEFDSAFEDTPYSGSSDDKTKGARSRSGSKNSNTRSSKRSRNRKDKEMGIVGEKSEALPETEDIETLFTHQGHHSRHGRDHRTKVHQVNEHEASSEPALFDMEVSPGKEGIMLVNPANRRHDYEIEDPQCSSSKPRRRHHSVKGTSEDERPNNSEEVRTHDDFEPVDNILLEISPAEIPQTQTDDEIAVAGAGLNKGGTIKEEDYMTTGISQDFDNLVQEEKESSSPGKNRNLRLDFATEGRISGECPPLHGSRNSLSKENGDFDVVYLVPDGGWGWMVLFGSILVNILIPGTIKSFGILFVEFLEIFDTSPAAAAWIPALSYWLYSSMGPFAGALAIRYSHRSVTIVGGLLASLGLMISYFATSIQYLYISYGIIGGLGAGLAYPIGVFMVGQYFDKKRGLANGLCTSGSALGSVLVPPLLRVLLVEYGCRGTILIMGGILLNVCVAAMFYEPISKHMKKTLIPKDMNIVGEEEVDQTSPIEMNKAESFQPQRTMTSPIPRKIMAPAREVAASLPIAIPFPQANAHDFRDTSSNNRRANGGRKATFQIGQDDDSWSEVASPLAARLLKEDNPCPSSPNKWVSFYNPGGIRVRGHLPGQGTSTGNDSNPELETLIHSNPSNVPPTSSASGTNLSLSGVGASRGQSRLNLTAIPEDDDTENSENGSRKVDWTFYSALPAAKQRLLRLSLGGTQLMGSPRSGQSQQNHPMAHPSSSALLSHYSTAPGLPRTLSMASNVSTSSFHYMSTIHHGSLLSAMQFDKNLPEYASTLTLKSAKASCCPSFATLKNICRKLTCGLWPKADMIDGPRRRKETELVPHSKKADKDKWKKFIDLSLLKDGMYNLMLISNSTTAVGYTNFIVLLPSYALAMGFDKQEAAYLLSIVAGADFVGRIGGAALSDLQFVSRRWYYILGLFFSGVALSLLPLAKTYTALAAMCAAFGLASGIYIGVTAVILADQLGAEKLGSSYGISLFLNGLLQLIGPPICGALLGHIGNLEPILTGLGVVLIFGALLWILAPFIEKRRREKSAAENGKPQYADDISQPQGQNANADKSVTSIV